MGDIYFSCLLWSNNTGLVWELLILPSGALLVSWSPNLPSLKAPHCNTSKELYELLPFWLWSLCFWMTFTFGKLSIQIIPLNSVPFRFHFRRYIALSYRPGGIWYLLIASCKWARKSASACDRVHTSLAPWSNFRPTTGICCCIHWSVRAEMK